MTGTSERLEIAEVAERARRILDQVERAGVGKRFVLLQLAETTRVSVRSLPP